ncbi:DoxX family protein [Corallococcus exiguus]|nr:DoxX family protein [Corallococcus exiguus]
MTNLQSPLVLLGRLMLALIFVVEGWGKLTHYAETAQYMANFGVSRALLPFVILVEFGGGILVAIGFLTRGAALALAAFCLLTAFIFHTQFADPDQLVQFYKNVAIAGGFLTLAAFGAGSLSIDAWQGQRRTVAPHNPSMERRT